MWKFTKKEKLSEHFIRTVLCIPGFWKTKEDIFPKGSPYIITNDILIDLDNDYHYTVELKRHDPKIKDSFIYTGRSSDFTIDFLDKIDSHTSVLYISGHSGNVDECSQLAKVSSELLALGGIGIKVETAGKSFTGKQWLELAKDRDTKDMYAMFVADPILSKSGTVFSCGMHNLGFCDVIVSGESFQNAVDIIKAFNFHQLNDHVLVRSGQVFKSKEIAGFFNITYESRQPFKGDSLFENAFGMWRLTRER